MRLMRRRSLIGAVTGAVLFALSLPAAAQQSLKLPPYKKAKLPNGLTLVLMEQKEVPIVSFSVVVRAGAAADPAGKEGLATTAAELLRKGTRTRTAEQIGAELDFVGGLLDFGATADRTEGRAEFLKKDLAAGLDLLSDVLMNPTFPQPEVDKLLKQSVDTVKQNKDSAREVIRTYFDAYLFAGHPYARPENGDERTLAAITRGDVAKFYEQHYGPQATTVVAVGDFDAAQMERALAEKFGAWKQRTPFAPAKLPEPATYKGRKLLLVDKPDSTQTFFLIGNVGVARTNPDRVGIEVVNTVFGDRFTSMLNDALRVNSGLTYGARSFFDLQRAPGPFAISTYTRNETTVQAIDMALDLLKKLHEQGLTEEQLRSAKAYIKGLFPTEIETTSQLAALLADLDFYGLDEREVNDYFAKVDALTVADAKRIIRQHFPQENLVFVLIGKASEIKNAVGKYAQQVDTKQISQAGF
jgi:zinc protease